jgi:hypothetical protein
VAKAETKSTITYVMLKAALPRLVEALGSPTFAEIALIQWCAERKVRWVARGIIGRIWGGPEAADAALRGLWTGTKLLPKLNWEESSAYKDTIRMNDGEHTGFTVYGILVVIEDIEAQLQALDPSVPPLATSPNDEEKTGSTTSKRAEPVVEPVAELIVEPIAEPADESSPDGPVAASLADALLTDVSSVAKSEPDLRTPLRERTEAMLRYLYPDGIPPKHEVTKAALIRVVQEEWGKSNLPNPGRLRCPSADTIG